MFTAPPPVHLFGNPLGVNIQPDQSASQSFMDRYLRALGPTFFRYGGGVLADEYNWQLNRDTALCSAEGHQSADFTGPCSRGDLLSFPSYALSAQSIHAAGMVQVNYGSGTPALAAAWAAQVYRRHYPVTGFELGNEPYGCSSVNIPITKPPVSLKNYEPETPAVCPYGKGKDNAAGMTLFAKSFTAHAPAFVSAIKAADPTAKIVLPYAMVNSPTSISPEWDHWVMRYLKGWDSINAMWYPSQSKNTHPRTSDLLAGIFDIPVRAAFIKADLARYGPGKHYNIGEENISNSPTKQDCAPPSATFAAGSALSWLAQGASSVSWWWETDNNNCDARGDFAMFNGSGHPLPPYYGWYLASILAQPHSVLSYVPSGNSLVLAFRSVLPGRHQAEAYVNLGGLPKKVSLPVIPRGPMNVTQYSEAKPAIRRSVSAPLTHLVLPGDSVTVFRR